MARRAHPALSFGFSTRYNFPEELYKNLLVIETNDKDGHSFLSLSKNTHCSTNSRRAGERLCFIPGADHHMDDWLSTFLRRAYLPRRFSGGRRPLGPDSLRRCCEVKPDVVISHYGQNPLS